MAGRPRLVFVLVVGLLAGCTAPSDEAPAPEVLEGPAWAENATRLLVFERFHGALAPDLETVKMGPAPTLDAVNWTLSNAPPFAHRPHLAAVFNGQGAAAGGYQAFLLRAGDYVVRVIADANASWIHVGWMWPGPECTVRMGRGEAAPEDAPRSPLIRLAAQETVLVEVEPPAKAPGGCPSFSFRATDRGVWRWAS